MQNRDRLYYQYALMNLAVLQADFGAYSEAVSAMLETVSTARENRDMMCLNFALNWLFHFGRAHPTLVKDLESSSVLGTGRETLAFLKVKARESGMWTLWSSVLMSEAKVGLSDGGSIASAWESITRASHVLTTRNMRPLFGQQLLLASSLWQRVGVAALSKAQCDIFLRCHSKQHSCFDDELKFVARSAWALAQRGKYNEALQRLDGLEANSLRSWKPSEYWSKYRGLIKLRKDLHQNNLDGAEILLNQLIQSSADDLEPDLSFIIDTLHLEYLTRRNDLSAAFTKLDSLLTSASPTKDIALHINLLLLKADLLIRASRPQRSLSLVLRATTLSLGSRILSALWPSIGALSQILISLSEFRAAVQLLTAVIPRALETEDVREIAKLYLALADANMGLAGKEEKKGSKRMECLMRADEALGEAGEGYRQLGDWENEAEVVAKRAWIWKIGGDAVVAAGYAARYVALREKRVQADP